MEKQKIQNLQEELRRLTERFNENMKRISLLLEYTKGKNTPDDFRVSENIQKAITERLELIKENFQINWDRVEILRKLKMNQDKYCTDQSIPDTWEKRTICNRDFFEKWRNDYARKEDFLMVEIIDILND